MFSRSSVQSPQILKNMLGSGAGGTSLIKHEQFGNVYNLKTYLGNRSSISVLDYGAIADGVTDTTAAINAAIIAASILGKRVVVPAASLPYMVNTSDGENVRILDGTHLTVEKGAVIEGIARNTTIYYMIEAREVDNWIIDGFGELRGDRDTFGDTRTGEFGFVVAARGCANWTIRDVKISDSWGDGIFATHSVDGSVQCKNINILNTECVNNRRNGAAITSALGGKVVGNTFRDTNGANPSAGIDIECDNDFNNIHGLSVAGNVSRNNDGYGFAVAASIHDTDTDKPQGVTLSGNTSSDNGKTGYFINRCRRVTISANTTERDGVLSGQHGIHVRGSTVGGVYNVESEDVIVIGNTIESPDQYGIYIDSSSDSNPVCDRNLVANNIIKNAGADAIYINSIGASENNIVSSNIIKNPVGMGIRANKSKGLIVSGNNIDGAGSRGISINAECIESKIDNNRVSRCQLEGVRFDPDDGTVLGNTVISCGQAFDNTYAGIELRSDRANVQMNIVRHGGGSKQHKYGIRVESGSDNFVCNNDLLNAGKTGNYSNAGTLTISVAGNRV